MTELQFDICYVIKKRLGFEIAEITRFLTLYGGTWLFMWGIDNHLETMLYYPTLVYL